MKKKIICAILFFTLIISTCSCGKSAEYSFHTKEQAEYLDVDYKLFKQYANGTDEKSRPEAITLNAKGDTLLISEKEDMSDVKSIDIVEGTASIYNLKIGTTYYYQTEGEKVKSFKVEDKAPRNLYVDGVTNVRDLGGYKTSDGLTLKQGVIFRSARFSENDTGEVMITEEGLKTVKEDLKIKTELDLRGVEESAALSESPLGSDVNYINIPLESGGNIINLNKDKLSQVFEVFGDEANYPIDFHCSIGTDRTGMIAFLINGLLGVDEEALYRDYLFSNFGNIGKMRSASTVKDYLDTVEMSLGDTLSEKIENYLIGVGVSKDDLDVLKKMMKEEEE